MMIFRNFAPRRLRNSSRTPSVIGKGGYGCVHNPPLKCENSPPNFSYKDKISKVITNPAEALEEYENYVKIHKIDPDEKYTLKTPILCKPAKNSKNERAIEKCHASSAWSYTSGTSTLPYPSDAATLLVIENGGTDLEKFRRSSHSRAQIDEFFKEFQTAFLGIQHFGERNFIHGDIKTENMLYNAARPAGKCLKIIDFGMSSTFAATKKDIMDGKYNYSLPFYFVFPIELILTQKRKNHNEQQVLSHFRGIVRYWGGGDQVVNRMMMDFKELESRVPKVVREKFVDMILKKYDSYALGFVVATVANLHNDLRVRAELHELAFHMFRPNVFERWDISRALTEYRTILGFRVATVAAPAVCKTGYEKVGSKCYKKCAAGQERNPATKRCRRRAGPAAAAARATKKKCPTGREISAISGRCVKKCSATQRRNPTTGRCIKR